MNEQQQLELGLFGHTLPKPKPEAMPKRKPKAKVKAEQLGPRYEYRVLHRRRCWSKAQGHLFQSLPPVERLLAKLYGQSPKWGALKPIIDVRVQRRQVGEWKDLKTPGLLRKHQ